MTYLALPAHDSSLVARLLRDGYIWLHFPEPLESEFRTDHALTSRRWVRLGLLFAALASAGSALIDPWVIAAASPAAIIVRYGVQLPVLIVLLITTDRRLYPRWYEPAIQVGGPLFAAGTILMAGYWGGVIATELGHGGLHPIVALPTILLISSAWFRTPELFERVLGKR